MVRKHNPPDLRMRSYQPAIMVLAVLAGACGSGDTRGNRPVAEGDTQAAVSLTGRPGDPERGRLVFVSREEGHCILCHQIRGLDVQAQGNLGPDLTHVAERLTEAQIRYLIIDPRQVWPDTVMPAYYRTRGLQQVGLEYEGQPVLNEEQIEDLVAFLREQK